MPSIATLGTMGYASWSVVTVRQMLPLLLQKQEKLESSSRI